MTTSAPTFKRTKNADTPETTSKYYLTNAKLLPAVIAAKEAGKLSDELAKMLMMLTRKYANRPCFSGYTYKEDMISEALANLCQNALKFNPERSKNPFAFYTSCINNSFLHVLSVEKKHRRIRDQLLIDMGENPSYNFAEEHRSQQTGEFGGELNELKSQIEEAKARVTQETLNKIAADAKAVEEAAALALLEGDLEAPIDEEIEPIDPASLLDFKDEE